MATIYLLVAAALIFGAGAYTAKKILRQFDTKQIMIMVPAALAGVIVIWLFLTLWNRGSHEGLAAPPTNQPTPSLRPDQE